MYFHSLKYSTTFFGKLVSYSMKVPGPNPVLIKSREKIHTDFKKRGSSLMLSYSKKVCHKAIITEKLQTIYCRGHKIKHCVLSFVTFVIK